MEKCGYCEVDAVLVTEVRDVKIKHRIARDVEDIYWTCPKCEDKWYTPGMMDATHQKAKLKIMEQENDKNLG